MAARGPRLRSGPPRALSGKRPLLWGLTLPSSPRTRCNPLFVRCLKPNHKKVRDGSGP